ncbi:MAG: LEA type 2 family protein [Desulfobacter sp.]|nr:LEA type 2 family protein [Desulfobacter sp.]WDP86122.1 MAG: LEA type 2 family protein [Desulfobacter sp.]
MFPFRNLVLTLCLFLTLFAAGCAGLGSGYESPTVNISSFKALPGQGAAPNFEIGLHITNPNRSALELKGVAYTVSVEGHKLLTGISNDLPTIEAYGQGEILLNGTVSLFNSIAFFADLATQKTNQKDLSYSLDAKLDTGAFHPIIRVNKKGTLSFESFQ